MYLNAVPFPALLQLINSLSAKPSQGEFLGKGNVKIFFSRGAWAMAEGINTILQARGIRRGKVWFPDYFCNESLFAVRGLPVELFFYPIEKETLNPDWQALERFIKKSCLPDIFVLVHYFGFPNGLTEAKNFCKHYGAVLMEDAAHVLLPLGGIGSSDVTVYSPRKILAVPQGGVLALSMKYSRQEEKKSNKNNFLYIAQWLVRRFVQKALLVMGLPCHFITKPNTSSAMIQEGNCNIMLSDNSDCMMFTRKLLKVMEENLQEIVEKRKENYELLYYMIKNFKGVRFPYPPLLEEYCPYVFPIIIEKESKPVIENLKASGIPADSWPDLPPEVLKSEQEHLSAIWLKQHIITLPIHHGLARKQIEYIAISLEKALKRD